MLRLAEIGLFLAPLVAFALWRLLAPRRAPSARFVATLAIALAVLACVLIWFSRLDTLTGDRPYVPEQFRNGRVVPGSQP